jgi:hypothetical protein
VGPVHTCAANAASTGKRAGLAWMGVGRPGRVAGRRPPTLRRCWGAVRLAGLVELGVADGQDPAGCVQVGAVQV